MERSRLKTIIILILAMINLALALFLGLRLTQALAIARRYAGAELSLGYLDGGGDALSAGWLAE